MQNANARQVLLAGIFVVIRMGLGSAAPDPRADRRHVALTDLPCKSVEASVAASGFSGLPEADIADGLNL